MHRSVPRAIPLLAVFISVFVFPSVVHAHATFKAWGEFPNGLVHPVVTPSHLIIMLGLGLLVAQQGLSTLKSPMAALLFSGTIALAMTLTGYFPGVYLPILVCVALVIGVLIAFGKPVSPRLLNMVLAAGAAAIGLDSTVETGSVSEKMQALFGTLACLGIVVFDLPFYLSRHVEKKKWMQIGVRVIGSWIIAISFMMLAFALRK